VRLVGYLKMNRIIVCITSHRRHLAILRMCVTVLALNLRAN